MGGNEQSSTTAMRARLFRVAGMVLVLAFVASWFVWGPFGLILYVAGLFNSLLGFMFLYLFLLVPLIAILVPIVAIHTILCWRELSVRAKILKGCVMVVMVAFVTSFGLGFAGMVPAPYDMFVRGFARYAERRADVPAIQDWLSTLDPNEYVGTSADSGGIPISPTEYPRAIARLRPLRRPHAVRVSRDDTGKLMVRLTWGGGFLGHWGIEVDDKGMAPQPKSEFLGYIPLAPGARVWYELD